MDRCMPVMFDRGKPSFQNVESASDIIICPAAKRMNIFARLRSLLPRRLTRDDPTFGQLHGDRCHYRGRDYVCWHASTRFTSHGQDVPVRVFSDEDGPTEDQQKLFNELRNRYPELREMMTAPLAAEYESIRKEWKLESRPLSTPSDVWDVVFLSSVEINKRDHNNSDLVLDHCVDWDADHDLNVSITDWKVDEVMFEG
jgi:hypothetical protein